MLAAGALLISLSILSAHGHDGNLDYMYMDYEDNTTDAPNVLFDVNDWMFDLMDESNVCDPNPCMHGGSCQHKSDTEFECLCPLPYRGKRCQKVKNMCENIRCGHGDCVVNLNKLPYYECKCKPPFQGPDCKTCISASGAAGSRSTTTHLYY